MVDHRRFSRPRGLARGLDRGRRGGRRTSPALQGREVAVQESDPLKALRGAGFGDLGAQPQLGVLRPQLVQLVVRYPSVGRSGGRSMQPEPGRQQRLDGHPPLGPGRTLDAVGTVQSSAVQCPPDRRSARAGRVGGLGDGQRWALVWSRHAGRLLGGLGDPPARAVSDCRLGGDSDVRARRRVGAAGVTVVPA
jgi:hypothetical protein